MAIDLGTTGCRSIIIDSELNILSYSYREYGLITPEEKFVEQDSELWWELTLETAKEAIAEAKISPLDIAAISVSSQGITVVPVDREFKPLASAISWLDMRAGRECEQIERDFGYKRIYSLTGKPISPAYTLPKILWLKKYYPGLYEEAYKLLMPMDFLMARLTGRAGTDYSMASGTLMYDLSGLKWSEEILAHYGISEEKLPELAPAGSFVGTVLPEVARELGLRETCRVALGAQDQKCAALGAGLDEASMTVSLGTAAAVSRLWHEAHTEVDNGVGWCGYVGGDSFVTEGVVSTACTSLRWLRDKMFVGEGYDVVDEEAEAAMKRGSSLLFHPYLTGSAAPEFYPECSGAFTGITLAAERGDFALAVMEGVAFSIRKLLEAMDAYGTVDRLVLFGGGAKSPLWCQLIADAVGMEIALTVSPEAAGAGAAILAAAADGEKLLPLKIGKTYTPGEGAPRLLEKYKKFVITEKRLWDRREINACDN